MADTDFNSRLPVRTEEDGDVVVKIADATVPSQQLKVESDGSINVRDNGGSLTVDATDLDIRDLAFATDSVDVSGSVVALDAPTLAALESITVQNGAGASAVNVQDGGNSITVDAIDLDVRDLVFATDKVDVSGSSDISLSASTLATLESITVQNPSGAGAVNIQDGGNSITVDATDLDIRDLSASQDKVQAWIRDAAGAAFSTSNPLPVTVTSAVPGTPIQNYDVAQGAGSGVAAGASVNHDYTVTALKTFDFSRVHAAAAGKMKIEIQVESGVATDVWATKFVGFNSTANPNIDIEVYTPIPVAAGVRVRVIKTNKDNQPTDLYSTIEGTEV